ncbi:MAG: hypothetical protein ACR2NM_16145 [Bythopirellula sp.]
MSNSPRQSNALFRRIAAAVAALIWALAGGSQGNPTRAADVRFWLSNADRGPDAPTINVLPDTTTSIDVWARPAAGFTLTAFALNLVAEQPGALSFQEITVHNPQQASPSNTLRHQLVFDSNSSIDGPFGPIGINLQDNFIENFSGLTFFNDGNDLDDGGGIGSTCQDEYCAAESGAPSWHIATVEFETSDDVGTFTELYLEISTQGIWHAEEDPTDTNAIFGTGPLAQERHGWSVAPGDVGECNPGADCRNTHKGLADAVINVVASISDADFDDDSDVDGFDFLIWQKGLGVGDTHAEGDANGNGVVDDHDLDTWQAQWDPTGGPLVAHVPEPSAVACLLSLTLLLAHNRYRVRLH